MFASLSLGLLATAALFNADATGADFCEEALRTKVVSGSVQSDGSLQTQDGVGYSKDTFWKQDNFWWACPCLTGHCVRICSDDFISQKETPMITEKEKQMVLILNNNQTEKNVLVYKHFKIVENASCLNGYPLDPEIENDSHNLLENGTIYFNHQSISEEHQMLPAKGFCLVYEDNKYKTLICPDVEAATKTYFKSIILPILCILSASFLLLTLLAFFLTPNNTNLHEISVIYQSGCLMITFVCLAINYLTGATSHQYICNTTAYLTFYCLLASFFWLNVMCVEIFITFRSLAQSGRIKFLHCSLYAWGVPALIAIVTLILDLTTEHNTLSPGIGKYKCWLQGFWSDLLYFNGFVFVLLSINTYLFGSTVYKLYQLKKETKQMLRSGDSRVHNPTGSHSQKDKDRLVLYIKLFLLMGGTWIMEIISWAVGGPEGIWYITDSINALRGVFIFWFCVWSNNSVRDSLRNRFSAPNLSQQTAVSYNSNSNSIKTDITSISARD